MQLRFKEGGHALGTLLPSDKPGHLRLQCPTFADPLEVSISSLSSIDIDKDELRQVASEHLFHLTSGTAVAGVLTELDDTSFVIDSPCLKKVRLPRAMLRHFGSNRARGGLIYAGPRGTDEWSATYQATDWKYEGGALITSKAGTTAIGNFKLPEKSEIRITLAWSTHPNFTLSLGCVKPAKTGEPIVSAASLEVWDGRLVLVREEEQQADVVLLPDLLSNRQRLELTIYLDQQLGTVAICAPSGRVLGRLAIPADHPVLKQLIAVSNHDDRVDGRTLRLEHCEVRQWNGELPSAWPEANGGVLVDDGQHLIGTLTALTADRQGIEVVDQDGRTTKVPLKKVQHAVVSPSTEEGEASTQSIAVDLADGSRLVGAWTQMEAEQVLFTLDGVTEPVRFSASDVVGVLGNFEEFKPSQLTGKIGQLQTETAMLKGCLVDFEGEGTLNWQALGASAPARLAAASRGKIEYGDPRQAAVTRIQVQTPQGQVAWVERPQPMPAVPGQPPPRIIAPRPVPLKIAPRVNQRALRIVGNGRIAATQALGALHKHLEPGLKLRQGDELLGKVLTIDHRGVTFESPETSTTFLRNNEIDAVILATNRVADTQSPEKLKRLMTVPRSSKNDPPTHLLISVNGDYLRGRLIKLDAQQTSIEVRLEEITLPTDRIAEIHWLRDRGWQEAEPRTDQPLADKPDASENDKLRVHVIRQSGRPLSFVPSAFSGDTLYGKSELLGDRKIAIADCITLNFGSNLIDRGSTPSEAAWKLELAAVPKVYQESDDTPREVSSPLVGKPAPEFTLPTTSGGKCTLRSLRGRVLVLDFWASWCGPCMETMPEVNRVVNEVGGDQVDLIAINLQETQERAGAAAKRLDLSATVALDEDGSVAQQYQATAIPQTVIVDRQGNVTHLFVGGGQRFLSEFAEALAEVVKAP